MYQKMQAAHNNRVKNLNLHNNQNKICKINQIVYFMDNQNKLVFDLPLEVHQNQRNLDLV